MRDLVKNREQCKRNRERIKVGGEISHFKINDKSLCGSSSLYGIKYDNEKFTCLNCKRKFEKGNQGAK